MAVATTDLYEASYYLLHGCALEAIEALQVDSELRCRLTFSGPGLEALQVRYLQGTAAANLFAFRRSYGELTALVGKAKRKAANRLKNGGTL